MKYLVCVITAFLLLSFIGITKKRITDKEFKYEFYTVPENKVTPLSDRVYYWFKGGAIHNSEYGVAGELLHDAFMKYYLSNQLAESGTFRYGLKEGVWKTWFQNGVLASRQEWRKGQRHGKYYMFSENGSIALSGKYARNKKSGRWIDFKDKDTLIYDNDRVAVKKGSKFLLHKKSVEKKQTDSIARALYKKEKAKKRALKTKGKSEPKNQDMGFLKRIFTKRDKGNVDQSK